MFIVDVQHSPNSQETAAALAANFVLDPMPDSLQHQQGPGSQVFSVWLHYLRSCQSYSGKFISREVHARPSARVQSVRM
jgi:hypothetical protein